MTVASAPTRLGLGTAAARNLATTTKSAPQSAEITPRWLLRMVPWVRVDSATYRVNRRLRYRTGDGRVAFVSTGASVRVVPEQLRELPPLRGFDDDSVLHALADRFEQTEFAAGDRLATAGEPSDRVFLIAHGRALQLGPGEYGAREGAAGGSVSEGTVRGVLGHGDHTGDRVLVDPDSRWSVTVTALTPGTMLSLSRTAVDELVARSEPLRAHLARVRASQPPPQNKYGEAAVTLAAGHSGEPDLPGTFVDYEIAPRELALSVAQTELRVHTRVADLYNDPMDQTGQQLRLTVAALRERQEHELVNNREFGLLHNADPSQRIHPRTGPPTPDDLDQLLARRRRTRFFLAHPRTIAAFGRECTRRGIYQGTAVAGGRRMLAWRGVPILSCDKIPVSDAGTSSVLALRTGEQHQGVVGLLPTRLPDEREPGLSVRLTGVDGKGIARYLVSAYYSVAVLLPDALGLLENVDLTEKA